MNILDEQYADVEVGHDRELQHIVAELVSLGYGGPSPQADLRIRHVLALSARNPRETRGPRSHREHARAGRWMRHCRLRLAVPLATSAALMIGVGTYLHVSAPTPVSAQTVLRHAASAGPGADMAAYATYSLSSTSGYTGNADVWIAYNAQNAPDELEMKMRATGAGPADLNVTVIMGAPDLSQTYGSGIGSRHIVQQAAPAAPDLTKPLGNGPSTLPGPAVTMKGIVAGTLLAQKLSRQPTDFTLHQETLNGISVYALQPAGSDVTYYFNAQSYMLEGADWMEDGASWQVRLTGSSTVPVSAVPFHTLNSTPGAKGQDGRPAPQVSVPPARVLTPFTAMGRA